MKGNPTAEEKRWLKTLAQFATETDWLQMMFGNVAINPNNFHLDHILGARAKRKINGVTVKVGEWAVMPLPVELHCITSNHKFNRTLKPGAFRKQFGHETELWLKMINYMEMQDYELPFDDDVIEAITR